jgi:DNA modification methylase
LACLCGFCDFGFGRFRPFFGWLVCTFVCTLDLGAVTGRPVRRCTRARQREALGRDRGAPVCGGLASRGWERVSRVRWKRYTHLVPQTGREGVQVRSPKNGARKDPKGAFDYYAGFSDSFVADVLATLDRDAVVMDPWNGAGTTTRQAWLAGHEAIGVDANPAAVIAARARLVGGTNRASLPPLAEHILSLATDRAIRAPDDSVLHRWFSARTADQLWQLERAIAHLLIDRDDPPPGVALGPETVSSVASYFYVALFRVVRSLVVPFLGSNPTWIKRAKTRDELIDLDRRAIRASFSEAHQSLGRRLLRPDDPPAPDRVDVRLANSRSLPVPADSVDAVITSPPYCTRIDYIIGTLPELAVLGLREPEVRHLRDSMIGTPTVHVPSAEMLEGQQSWGPHAQRFHRAVRKHSSRASAGYYARHFAQYFDAMVDSLGEVARVIRPGGTATIVLQDSYYKEIRLDLPKVLDEMARAHGWRVGARHRFPVHAPKATIHPYAKRYRQISSATEIATTYRT